MKNFTRLFVILLAAVLMSGCSSLDKMKKNANLVKYEITPKVLETHAGNSCCTGYSYLPGEVL